MRHFFSHLVRAYSLEKKPFLGFQLFKQREGKEEEKKFKFGTLIFVSIELWYGTWMYGYLFRFVYGFVG